MMPAVMMTNRGWKGIAYDHISILFDYLVDLNIAKGTTDPRVEFILPKQLLKVISEVQT